MKAPWVFCFSGSIKQYEEEIRNVKQRVDKASVANRNTLESIVKERGDELQNIAANTRSLVDEKSGPLLGFNIDVVAALQAMP